MIAIAFFNVVLIALWLAWMQKVPQSTDKMQTLSCPFLYVFRIDGCRQRHPRGPFREAAISISFKVATALRPIGHTASTDTFPLVWTLTVA